MRQYLPKWQGEVHLSAFASDSTSNRACQNDRWARNLDMANSSEVREKPQKSGSHDPAPAFGHKMPMLAPHAPHAPHAPMKIATCYFH
jgi:hypothetical protein